MYNAGQTFPSCGVVDIKKTRIFNHLKFAILWLCKFGIEIGTDMAQICVQECSGLQFQFTVSFMLALQSGSSYPFRGISQQKPVEVVRLELELGQI